MSIAIEKIDSLAIKVSQAMTWSNVYGSGRTLLATGTLLTLIFNSNTTLFLIVHSPARFDIPVHNIGGLSFFYLLREHLNIAKAIAILILIVVASGWRPRLTGFFHWYIAFSFDIYTVVADGGDQITSVLTLLLMPICFTDKRIWHWNENSKNEENPYSKLIAYFSYASIRLQVALLYLDSAVEKFKVNEWRDGTALWYWFDDPILGLNSFWKPIVYPLLKNPIIVNLLSWFPIAMELTLFLGLTMSKSRRYTLLTLGIGFHLSIMVLHGLVSFFFAMSSALILYLRPWNQPFNLTFWTRYSPKLGLRNKLVSSIKP